jgi:Ca2+-binding RTX toxin-like protein
MHGGQPGLAYGADGRDTVDYSGAAVVQLDAPAAPVAHLKPDFVVTHTDGVDHLFSIEDIAWDDRSDRLVIGKGVGLAAAPLSIDLKGERATGRGDVVDLARADTALSIAGTGSGALHLGARPPQSAARSEITIAGAEWIVGSPHGDRMVLPAGLRGVEGGPGNDLLDLRAAGAVAVSGGAGNDTIIVGRGVVTAEGGDGADRFVIAEPGGLLVIADASAADRIVFGTPPSRVAVTHDTSAPHDLLVRVGFTGETAHDAEILVRDFHPGDLGLDAGHDLALATDGAGGFVLVSGDAGPGLVSDLWGFSHHGAGIAGFTCPDHFGLAMLPDGLHHG